MWIHNVQLISLISSKNSWIFYINLGSFSSLKRYIAFCAVLASPRPVHLRPVTCNGALEHIQIFLTRHGSPEPITSGSALTLKFRAVFGGFIWIFMLSSGLIWNVWLFPKDLALLFGKDCSICLFSLRIDFVRNTEHYARSLVLHFCALK